MDRYQALRRRRRERYAAPARRRRLMSQAAPQDRLPVKVRLPAKGAQLETRRRAAGDAGHLRRPLRRT